jgi:hypothetical protein
MACSSAPSEMARPVNRHMGPNRWRDLRTSQPAQPERRVCRGKQQERQRKGGSETNDIGLAMSHVSALVPALGLTQRGAELPALLLPALILGFQAFLYRVTFGLHGGIPGVVLLFGSVEDFLRLGDSHIPALALLGPRLLFPPLGGFPRSLLLFEGGRGFAGFRAAGQRRIG